MPTFTTIALETLLEPRARDSSYKNNSNDNNSSTLPLPLKQKENEKILQQKKKPPVPNHIYISPALYTTPKPTPVLDSTSSSGSLSPSPYVFNRKGRRGPAAAAVVDCPVEASDLNENGNGEVQVGGEEIQMVDDVFSGGGAGIGIGDENSVAVEDEDFLDPRCDSVSVASNCSNDLTDFGRQVERKLSFASNQGEFFDASEDFSSDGSNSNVPSCGLSIESELRATRVGLLEEIDRRKSAEDALATMYSQWLRVRDLLASQAGPTFPTLSNPSTEVQLENNKLERFSQEVIVARFVAEAVGKGEARAEAEQIAAFVIESKDQEISRLRDRLQYYEAMSREMSQRNLEVMEVARRQRERKRGQRKWLWSCLGLSIAIGASVIAYSYFPQTSKHQLLLTDGDSPSDTYSISSSEPS